jgi:hypothetical protein
MKSHPLRPWLVRCLTVLAVTLSSVACGGEESGGGEAADSPAAPLLGSWDVENESGERTGQTVVITEDSITMNNPNGLNPSEGSATFRANGEVIEADWYGSEHTFSEITDSRVVMSDGSSTWILVRGEGGE